MEEMPLLRDFAPMSPAQARQLSPLQLAYLGDGVWELLVRELLLSRGLRINHLHREAIRRVNATAQAEAMAALVPLLAQDELDVAHRGRNTRPHHGAPKNQSVIAYAEATALETLFGYLYLTGQDERLLELFHAAQEEESHAQDRTEG